MEKQEQEKLQVSYLPMREDFLAAYRDNKVFQTSGGVALAESVVLAALSIWFFSAFLRQNQLGNLFFSIVCLLLIGVIYFVPWITCRLRAKKEADSEVWQMCFEKEFVTLCHGEDRFQLPLNQTKGYWQKGDRIYIFLPNRAYWILPLPQIEGELQNRVAEKIKDGFYLANR